MKKLPDRLTPIFTNDIMSKKKNIEMRNHIMKKLLLILYDDMSLFFVWGAVIFPGTRKRQEIKMSGKKT